MLSDVWRWAGRYRTSERNIGINHWEIPMALRVLLDDVKLWIERGVYPPDEIAVRLHHRFVAIHAFPNGNGRHARLRSARDAARRREAEGSRPSVSCGNATLPRFVPPMIMTSRRCLRSRVHDGASLPHLTRSIGNALYHHSGCECDDTRLR
jgi:hypothetical protein